MPKASLLWRMLLLVRYEIKVSHSGFNEQRAAGGSFGSEQGFESDFARALAECRSHGVGRSWYGR